MGHREAGECSSRTAVEMVLPLDSGLVRKVGQFDFLAVMAKLLGCCGVAVGDHLQSCLKGCYVAQANARLWACRRTIVRGEQDHLAWYHMSALSSLACAFETCGNGRRKAGVGRDCEKASHSKSVLVPHSALRNKVQKVKIHLTKSVHSVPTSITNSYDHEA